MGPGIENKINIDSNRFDIQWTSAINQGKGPQEIKHSLDCFYTLLHAKLLFIYLIHKRSSFPFPSLPLQSPLCPIQCKYSSVVYVYYAIIIFHNDNNHKIASLSPSSWYLILIRLSFLSRWHPSPSPSSVLAAVSHVNTAAASTSAGL